MRIQEGKIVMELQKQWGVIEKKNKRKRKGPQNPYFHDPSIEDRMLQIVENDPDYFYADRHIRVLQLEHSIKKRLAGEMKRSPSSLPLHKASEQEKEEYIEKGAGALPKGHVLKRISDYFCPSPHQRIALKEMFPEKDGRS
jgi:hypothetical protein